MLLKLNEAMSLRTINNESFIYNRDTSEIHSLNNSGSFILDMILKGNELKSIPNKVQEKYETDLSSAENDTKKFIEEMITKKVLIKSD